MTDEPKPPDPGATKIYTKTGDKGKTSLIGGARVSKADSRLDAYGTVDEFNSALGLAVAFLAQGPPGQVRFSSERTQTLGWCASLQARLFSVGSRLACEDPALWATLPAIEEAHLSELEEQMDEMSRRLQPLHHFVLPTGCPAAAAAHLARTVCRRAERLCVGLSQGTAVDPILIHFLNRASDWCFVLARYLNWMQAEPETLWKPRS